MDENAGMLSEEQAYYDQHAQELLVTHPNLWLLIHGSKLIGTYADMDGAVAAGVREFGSEPFLVRRAGDKQITFTAPALSLGVL